MRAKRHFLPETSNPNKGKTFESFQLKRTLEIPAAELLGSSIRLWKSTWRCSTAICLQQSPLADMKQLNSFYIGNTLLRGRPSTGKGCPERL